MNSNGNLYVQMGTRTTLGGEQEQTVNLHIEDRISGVILVDLDLSPSEVWKLLQGSTGWFQGYIVPPERAGRIGKRQIVELIDVPKEIANRFASFKEWDEAKEAARVWAQENLATDWDEMDEPYLSQRGWSIRCSRWVDPEEAPAS